MAGLLTHLLISLGLFLFVYLFFKKWYYGFSAFLGQLMPDIIKFGFVAIKIESLSYAKILRYPLFYVLEKETGFHLWTILFFFVIAFAFVLYSMKIIDKGTRKKMMLASFIFCLSALLHLIVDIFIIERSPWV